MEEVELTSRESERGEHAPVAPRTQCVGLVANFERHNVVVEHGRSVILREIEVRLGRHERAGN